MIKCLLCMHLTRSFFFCFWCFFCCSIGMNGKHAWKSCLRIVRCIICFSFYSRVSISEYQKTNRYSAWVTIFQKFAHTTIKQNTRNSRICDDNGHTISLLKVFCAKRERERALGFNWRAQNKTMQNNNKNAIETRISLLQTEQSLNT